MTEPSLKSQSQGPVAVVTGAAGIVGPGICRALSADGWRVAACDLSEAHFASAENLGASIPRAATFYADLTTTTACAELIADIETSLGPIGLLVHGAVDDRIGGSLKRLTPEVFSQTMALNLAAPLFLVQAARASLIETGGSVVLISSVMAQNFARRRLLYTVSKSALETLTRGLAFELAHHGVRVNCVRIGSVPGPAFLRPLLEKLDPDQARRLCEAVMPAHESGHGEEAGVRLSGRPDDIGAAVAYLASPKAEFVHGAIFPVDGGFDLRPPRRREGMSGTKRTKVLVREWLAAEGLDHLLEEDF